MNLEQLLHRTAIEQLSQLREQLVAGPRNRAERRVKGARQ
jgi:hypothetical protein